jgi:hypothetical protein
MNKSRRIEMIEALDQIEDSQLTRLASHPAFQQIDKFTDDEFRNILLQRRFLSLAFTPVYDIVLDAITIADAKTTVRGLLLEEYSGKESHRQKLVRDLIALGVSRKVIFSSLPTAETAEVIARTFRLLVWGEISEEFYQIKLMTIIRVWGEILVSTEYQQLWARMKVMGLHETPNLSATYAPTFKVSQFLRQNRPKIPTVESMFYFPHLAHDRKEKQLNAIELGKGAFDSTNHSEKIARVLLRALETKEQFDYCSEIMQSITNVRYDFYDQFTPDNSKKS